MKPSLTRRRFLGVSAAAAGLAVLPFGQPRAEAALVTWHGQAMGAICTLQIHHPERNVAAGLIDRVLGEVRRLERMFSLYDPESLLVRLNRTGVLADPPAEFVDLLHASQGFAQVTDGAFDVTVQPLWTLFAEHFGQENADPGGPPEARLREVLARIGHQKLVVGRDRVVLPRSMAITLNGIAQGFVTDRVVDMLRAEGIGQSLVDMGETRVIGEHPDGRPWEVAVADPDDPARAAAIVPVVDRAVATSGPYGFRFDEAGRFNHLFQPGTGLCAWRYRSVSVVARSATTADGLSTAFCFMEPERVRAVAGSAGVDLVHLIDAQGRTERITL